MEGQQQASASADMFEPCAAAVEVAAAENPSVENFRGDEQCGTVAEMDDSQLIGVPVVVAGGDDVVMEAKMLEIEVKVEDKSGVKRKRGRPPRVQGKIQAKPTLKVKDEEDVCFICFDGGNLVLCDRRGCPKAYHPTCIKRDESFFRSKAKWNCGWHICSNCEKASHYMCYTCTYSLCKGCIKEADILCVRGNKGFCTTCMRTIMLIENSVQGNKDMIQVDFDDKSSWEYLFKVYWIYLKTKLSLTSDELTKAKNPGKGAVLVAHKSESSDELYDGNDDKGYSSESFSGYQEGKTHRRKKIKKQPKVPDKEDSLSMTKTYNEKALSLPEGADWASKELLEFVAHMKNGDTSVLSQFDVQALLLEYIKINNLRDPRRKSQIICDSRLGNMFGKARVGHFEMLKLLELHFLIKEDSQANSIIQGGFIGPIATQFEVDGAIDNQIVMGKDKRRKTRKMGVDKGPQTNLDEYAAIDFHNISLIYLRRCLMESLIEDIEKFQGKVVGSVVRIRISSSEQKQDYRLVRVVGTSKVAAPYKVGQRTVDVMLEILNLDKKEVISIDEISNQEFSKDECIRLRQSIKCGLVKRFTVGEILEKAVALQAVRVNDGLEAETLRLNHLRDRASEKGHRKELRECVEKLQLLNTPEERQRRQLEIPEVHADPRMNPSYDDSDDAGESDHKKQDDNVGSRHSNLSKRGRKPISQQRTGDTSKVKSISARKNSATCSEQNSNMSTTVYPVKERATRTSKGENGPLVYPQRDAYGTNSWETPKNLVDPSGSATGAWNNQAVVRSESFTGVSSGTSTVPFSSDIANADNSEIEKNWHYRDPSGTIQGPFSMLQLRKWSTSGYFPPDLRIWRINEKQDDSLLLTDAMNGQNQKEPQVMHTSYDATVRSNGNNEFFRSSFSASRSPPGDIISGMTQAGRLLQGRDLVKGKESWSDHSQMHSPLPSPTFSGGPSETVSYQGMEDNQSGRWYTNQNHGPGSPDRTAVIQSNEKCSNSQSNSGSSSKQDWKPPTVDCSSDACNITSSIVSVTKSIETSEQNHEVDFPDLPSPTPKPSNEDHKGLEAENKQSVSSIVPIPDSGPSWSSASSLVGGEAQAQLPQVAGDWGGYSPTPAKPSVDEWDSSPVSGSSLKPTELGGDFTAMPTSKGDQQIHSSPPYPASTTSVWQSIVTGPNEFPLAEESVSDLLAEVDAMESLNGPPSPTSAMNCTVDMTQVSKDECFSSVEGLSPTLDPGKSDALSCTSDVLMPCQSARTNEPDAQLQADVCDPQKRSGGHCSTSDEAEGEANPKMVSDSQREASSEIQPPESSSASWDMPATDGEWRGGPETTDTGWGPVQRNATLNWGGPVQININMGWANGQGNPQANANINWGNAPGNSCARVSQPKYGGERFPCQRERGFQGGGSGYGRDRSSWNRQSSFGSGGGGGSFGPPPKGQRICKFYESGRCKKGAFCNYLHP